MKITKILTASVLALTSTVANSAVWLPDVNDSTGNYQEISFISFGVDSGIYDLVLFDAGTSASTEPSNTSLTLTSVTGIVDISANPAPYTASVGADTALLGDTAEFELALWNSTSSTFSYVTGFTEIIPGNAYTIEFGNVSGEVHGVDLAPIPVPAAVWLFGSGLIGLAGIARRKQA